jgi:hypothetical protein
MHQIAAIEQEFASRSITRRATPGRKRRTVTYAGDEDALITVSPALLQSRRE